MNRDDALKLLRAGPEGIAKWNDWRANGGDDPPFLSAAQFSGADLSGANLRFVSLALAQLDDSNLSGADLSGASIRQADLYNANLENVTLNNADCRAADLTSVNLSNAECVSADFAGADLSGATIAHSNFVGTDLTGADLSNTDMSGVNLRNAALIGTRMHGARVARTEFAGTVISCSLAGVTDLDLTIHHTPSPIAISSILSMTGEMPTDFLRGCGLRAEEVEHFKSVLVSPIRFNACFLCYHESDEELANRLHGDLQESGIRCWKRRHRRGEFEVGEAGDIERTNCGIQRLILLSSKDALNSPSILREINWAMRQEDWQKELNAKAESKTKASEELLLFPIPVDDFAQNGWEHPYRDSIINRQLAEQPANWADDDDSYRSLLTNLLHALKNEAKC